MNSHSDLCNLRVKQRHCTRIMRSYQPHTELLTELPSDSTSRSQSFSHPTLGDEIVPRLPRNLFSLFSSFSPSSSSLSRQQVLRSTNSFAINSIIRRLSASVARRSDRACTATFSLVCCVRVCAREQSLSRVKLAVQCWPPFPLARADSVLPFSVASLLALA